MRARAALLAAVSSLGACTAPVVARPGLDVAPIAALRAADYPGAAAILQGFDPPTPADDWRVGDRALLALEVHDGDRTDRRLLLLEVENVESTAYYRATSAHWLPVRQKVQHRVSLTSADGAVEERTVASTPIRVRLVQFDADGTERRRSSLRLFEELLANGLEPLHTSDDQDRQVRALLLLLTLQELGTADPTLAELLFAVVDRPGLLSVLWHLGAHIRLESPVGGIPCEIPGIPVGRPPTVQALDVSVNGSPALYGDVVATSGQHPFAVAGGILGGVARHARDPGRWVVVRLLAARRGAR